MGHISFVVFHLPRLGDRIRGGLTIPTKEFHLRARYRRGQNTMNRAPVCRVEPPRPASPCGQGRGTQSGKDTGGGNGDPVGDFLARSKHTWPGT